MAERKTNTGFKLGMNINTVFSAVIMGMASLLLGMAMDMAKAVKRMEVEGEARRIMIEGLDRRLGRIEERFYKAQ